MIIPEKQARLKKALYNVTCCDIQHDGWTCGTCFFNVIDVENEQEAQEAWWAVLLYRGDYVNGEYFYLEPAEVDIIIDGLIKQLELKFAERILDVVFETKGEYKEYLEGL